MEKGIQMEPSIFAELKKQEMGLWSGKEKEICITEYLQEERYAEKEVQQPRSFLD